MKIQWNNKKKRYKALFFVIILFCMTGGINKLPVFAQVNESEADGGIKGEVAKESEEVEVRFPNKLEAKDPPSSYQSSLGNDVRGSRGEASEATNARAGLTENVDNANKEYPVYHNSVDDGCNSGKYSADARQFITFKTGSGKTFYLIINHDEDGQNVMLLTEVSEDDLLNMVETKEKPKEEVKKIIEPVMDKSNAEELATKEEGKVDKAKDTEKKTEDKSKSDSGVYLFLGLIIVAALGAGYYFKIYKKKLKENEEDEE